MPYTRSTKHPELFRPGDGKVWWCFLPNPEGGRRLRESTGHVDERAAYAEFCARARAPLGVEPSRPQRSVLDALAARIDWLASAREGEDVTRKKLAQVTVDFYEKKSKVLVRVLGSSTLLSDIGHKRIREYILQRTEEGVSASTIQKEFVTLSKAMDLARKDGVEAPLFSDIVPEDFAVRYVPKARWLTEKEVTSVLKVLPEKRAAVVAFLVGTGATYPSESRVVASDIRKAKGRYVVHIPGTKRETRDRRIRIPPYAERYIELARPWVPFEKWGNVRRDLLDAAEELKIPPFCPTDLRRTFAQWLVRSGVPYELAYPMMGHSSDAMLKKIYGRRDATAVGDLVDLALKKAPKGARG